MFKSAYSELFSISFRWFSSVMRMMSWSGRRQTVNRKSFSHNSLSYTFVFKLLKKVFLSLSQHTAAAENPPFSFHISRCCRWMIWNVNVNKLNFHFWLIVLMKKGNQTTSVNVNFIHSPVISHLVSITTTIINKSLQRNFDSFRNPFNMRIEKRRHNKSNKVTMWKWECKKKKIERKWNKIFKSRIFHRGSIKICVISNIFPLSIAQRLPGERRHFPDPTKSLSSDIRLVSCNFSFTNTQNISRCEIRYKSYLTTKSFFFHSIYRSNPLECF